MFASYASRGLRWPRLNFCGINGPIVKPKVEVFILNFQNKTSLEVADIFVGIDPTKDKEFFVVDYVISQAISLFQTFFKTLDCQ